MYELFLTTLVDDDDIQAACSVLGGLCAMPAWQSLHRVLYFKGPAKPGGISKQNSIVKTPRKDIQMLWKDLHQQLSRQSYILQARYEVFKDKDFGPTAPENRSSVTQRKKTEIWDQKNLLSVMRDNNYQFKSEAVEETYQFFRDDVEFCLSRHYILQMNGDNGPLTQTAPWDTMSPADPGRRWMFLIKVHVHQDNKPDEILKAHEQLANIRRELEGVFDFKMFDRRIHDTRVAVEMRNAPAPLPQVMTVTDQR
ncbi:mediator of RNA polymerase II transcription subunit 18 [Colletotrichum liriopes]|uniref:Mediator of RNA polymerase II transcription subunit 18 n=1 Tax=Colletotrichum liriopes TaxID=708192 RepID=A0AA37GIT0_9PEZI|nr:mediator of RNA polymerase II transcription subunit 18 [Colletotrichum liriopes]